MHELHADEAARPAPADDEQPHLEVDVAESRVGERARGGAGGDLRRVGGGRDRGRDADEDQQRRHEETAADAEQAGEEAPRAPPSRRSAEGSRPSVRPGSRPGSAGGRTAGGRPLVVRTPRSSRV